jgi:non-heme chloroperoxidase
MVKTAANPLGLTKKVFDDLQAQLAAGPLSAKLLKNGTLKTYKGFPHGMPTTEADTINSDLLAFIKS